VPFFQQLFHRFFGRLCDLCAARGARVLSSARVPQQCARSGLLRALSSQRARQLVAGQPAARSFRVGGSRLHASLGPILFNYLAPTTTSSAPKPPEAGPAIVCRAAAPVSSGTGEKRARSGPKLGQKRDKTGASRKLNLSKKKRWSSPGSPFLPINTSHLQLFVVPQLSANFLPTFSRAKEAPKGTVCGGAAAAQLAPPSGQFRLINGPQLEGLVQLLQSFCTRKTVSGWRPISPQWNGAKLEKSARKMLEKWPEKVDQKAKQLASRNGRQLAPVCCLFGHFRFGPNEEHHQLGKVTFLVSERKTVCCLAGKTKQNTRAEQRREFSALAVRRLHENSLHSAQ